MEGKEKKTYIYYKGRLTKRDLLLNLNPKLRSVRHEDKALAQLGRGQEAQGGYRS